MGMSNPYELSELNMPHGRFTVTTLPNTPCNAMPKKPSQPATRPVSSRHGDLLKGAALRQALGYGSERSFYRATAKKTAPVALFKVDGKGAWCARTRDVEIWLASLGEKPAMGTNRRGEKQ